MSLLAALLLLSHSAYLIQAAGASWLWSAQHHSTARAPESSFQLLRNVSDNFDVYQPPRKQQRDPPFSTHNCFHEKEEHTVCNFTKVILYQGSLYYVSDSNISLPRPRLSHVRSPPLSELSLTLLVRAPSELPFDWATTEKLRLRTAIFWLITHFGNYGHLFGEQGPNMHFLMCNMLGLCHYEKNALSSLQILWTNQNGDDMGNKEMVGEWPSQINDMFPCLAKAAPMFMDAEAIYNTPIVIDRAAAGVGPKCRSLFWCRHHFNAAPPEPNDMLLWKERVSKCLGVDAEAVVKPVDPVIAFVDRGKGSHRSITNLDDAVEQTKEQFQQADVAKYTFNSKWTLAEQAAVYNKIDILISVHGSELANLVFMPKGAVYIDIMPAGFMERTSWSMRFVRDMKAAHLVYLVLKEQPVTILDAVKEDDVYKQLTADEQGQVEHGKCPRDDIAETSCSNWFWMQSTIEVDIFVLKDLVWQALHHIGAGYP